MKDSKLTIQRPEGCPEWAEIGVWVMVKDEYEDQWQGPLVLVGFDELSPSFRTNGRWWTFAKPYIKWQPEPGEWVAFSGGGGRIMTGQYGGTTNGHIHAITGYGLVNYLFRLVDDGGNLIDLRCTVEELKERTEWL